MQLSISRSLSALALLAPTAAAGIGDFTTAVTPDFRGEPGARFDGYDVFTQAAFLPNFPDLAASCAGSTLTQLDPAAVVTSSGSIYSFGTLTSFELDLPGGDLLAELTLQTRTVDFGAPLAGSSFLLSGIDGAGLPVSLPPTAVNALTPVGNELEVVWDPQTLAGLDLTDARVTFSAADVSCATDVVLVDYRVERAPLETDVDVLSLAAGGTQTFDIDAGADRGGDFYLVLGSATGDAPGLPVGGAVLPLVVDAYTTFTLNSANSAVLTGTFGALDPCGRASAAVTIPAGTNPNLAGLTFHHAFLTLDAGTFFAEFASNAASLDFTL